MDYNKRAEAFGFAPRESIIKTAALPDVIFLDVRSDGEISAGKLRTGSKTWKHSQCTTSSAPQLETKAASVLPDKSAPVIVYCGSGKRASIAKNVLESQGYENVLNAGGLGDLGYLDGLE